MTLPCVAAAKSYTSATERLPPREDSAPIRRRQFVPASSPSLGQFIWWTSLTPQNSLRLLLLLPRPELPSDRQPRPRDADQATVAPTCAIPSPRWPSERS